MDSITLGGLELIRPTDHIRDYTEGGDEVIQPKRPLRATAAGVRRRGNHRTEIQITFERDHETYVAARAFIRAYRRDLMQETATTVTGAVTGQGAATWRLIDAAVTIPPGNARAKNLTSIITLHIQGAEEL